MPAGDADQKQQFFPQGAYRQAFAEKYVEQQHRPDGPSILTQLRQSEAWGSVSRFAACMSSGRTRARCCAPQSCSPAQTRTVSHHARGWETQIWEQQSASWVWPDGTTGWERARKANVPGIHVMGLYDIFRNSQLETFQQLNSSTSKPHARQCVTSPDNILCQTLQTKSSIAGLVV